MINDEKPRLLFGIAASRRPSSKPTFNGTIWRLLPSWRNSCVLPLPLGPTIRINLLLRLPISERSCSMLTVIRGIPLSTHERLPQFGLRPPVWLSFLLVCVWTRIIGQVMKSTINSNGVFSHRWSLILNWKQCTLRDCILQLNNAITNNRFRSYENIDCWSHDW